jgi:hypothetical protein
MVTTIVSASRTTSTGKSLPLLDALMVRCPYLPASKQVSGKEHKIANEQGKESPSGE